MDIERVDPAYHFGDHTTLDLLYDTERMRVSSTRLKGAGGRYRLARSRACVSILASPRSSRGHQLHLDFVDLSRVGPLALAVNPLDLLLPQFNQMAKYFKDETWRFSVTRSFTSDFPLRPRFSSHRPELTDGVWYPIGGFDKVRGAWLADEEGVTTKTNEVAAILLNPLGDARRRLRARRRGW